MLPFQCTSEIRFAYSLDLDEVGVVDVGHLEDLGPEASKLMAVIDLNDVELLHDA